MLPQQLLLAVVEQDKSSPNYEPLQDNLRRLRAIKLNGAPLEIIELPMPRRVVREDLVLPMSYANFYIANKVVLAAIYNEPNDQAVLDTLAKCFPTRRVVGIDCNELIWGLGAFHCLTQQQPTV